VTRAFARGPASIEANLTPMIDIVFLLVVFFVLVSQIVDLDTVDMDLPSPKDAAALAASDDPRVVINLIPKGDGLVEQIQLGGAVYSTDTQWQANLSRRLAGLLAVNSELRINIRSDQATAFVHVSGALQSIRAAATEAGVDAAHVNLVVIDDDPGRAEAQQ